MPNISTSYRWAVNTCNAPNIGYSQIYRNEQTVDGITYYDCASFVWYALLRGGFDVVKAYNETMWQYTGNAFTVSYMDRCLTYLGFTRYNALTQSWAKGDIMVTDGHCEMVYDEVRKICMGAHSSDYDLDYQVSISNYPSPKYWTYGYHYGGQIVSDTMKGKKTGVYARDSYEAQTNAENIYNELTQLGWSLNAISSLIACIEYESGYNPLKWEHDIAQNPSAPDGYGFLQFKPCNTYITNNQAEKIKHYNPYYLGHEGDAEDGYAQLTFIDKYLNYTPTEKYEMTYESYKKSDEPLDILVKVFFSNGLHSNTEPPDTAFECAEYWADFLTVIIPPEPDPTRKIIRKLPLIYYIKPFL